MKKKLVIINQSQFGYHSDTYYYCKYLRSSFNITYICWDYSKKKIKLRGITVIYISRSGNLVVRNLRFIFQVIKELKKGYHFHFIKYFRGCSIIKLIYMKKKFIVDIRSGSIKNKKIDRFMYDFLMKMETKPFEYVSVISKSLAQKNDLPQKTYILPLGADIISTSKKNFDSIKLLYVGTLENRNIADTIIGFSKFYHEYKEKINILYTIVGSGHRTEEKELKELVQSEKIGAAVEIKGQIPHDEIHCFFDSNNIGVSYIPKTEYFNLQPPTKTFEYLLSGMPVIATDTLENKAVIHNGNGILINDTSDSFYNGLVQIYENKNKYDSNSIRSASMGYTWKKIVRDLNLKIHFFMNET